MPNSFVHVELNTGDLSAAKKFYRALFDWKLTDAKMGPGMVYTMVEVGKGVGGGMQKKPMPEAPTQWLSYVEVDDIRKTVAKARKLGANVVVDTMPIPGVGAMAIFIDPTGATLGVFQPEMRAPAKKPGAKKKPAARKPAARKKR